MDNKKIEELKKLVTEYNKRHALNNDNTTKNPGRAVLDIFNSTEFVEKYNKENHENTTLVDWEFEPDKTYYDLEFFDFKKANPKDIKKAVATLTDATIKNYTGPWYYEECRQQIMSTSFTYFYQKVKKLLAE